MSAKLQKKSVSTDIYCKNCMSNYMLLTEMSAYSNAIQRYGRDAADFWAQYDFSPTKRYVKKMCDLFYIDKIPQNEIAKIFGNYILLVPNK